MPRNSKHQRVEPIEPPYDAEAAAALELLGPPIALCGWYHAISFTVRSLRLPLEPGTAPISGA